MRTIRILFVTCAGAAIFAAQTAHAQGTRDVVIRLHKAGDTLSIKGAPVTVDHVIEAGTTDATGRVKIPDLEDGGHIVEVTATGYESIFDNFNSGPDVKQPIEFALRAVPKAEKPKGTMTELHVADFDRRRLKAVGTFFTGAQLDKARGRPMTNLLKVDAKAVIVAGPGNESYAALDASGTCYAAVVLDGLRIYPYAGAKPLDLDKIFAEQFAAVEFYARPALVPAELKDASTCGALVLWSRDGN